MHSPPQCSLGFRGCAGTGPQGQRLGRGDEEWIEEEVLEKKVTLKQNPQE